LIFPFGEAKMRQSWHISEQQRSAGMFQWMKNRLLQGCAEQSLKPLQTEYGDGPGTTALALAMGYACCPTGCPDGFFARDSFNDQLMKALRRIPQPCEPFNALAYCEQWQTGRLLTEDVFLKVWGVRPEELMRRLAARFDDDAIEMGWIPPA
jgi:hypothetical protein